VLHALLDRFTLLNARGDILPITPFLKGQAFDPEATRAMGVAFDKARQALGLADRTDRATEIVAALIIESAQTGERDPDRLCAAAVKALKP
jgi:hypothetical protein